MQLKNLFFAALIAAPMALFAQDYKVDVTHTNVGFSVKHLMISTVRGNFGTFEGDFSLDPKSGVPSRMNASIDVAAIDTGIVKRDDHLRSPDFFDVAKHPKMTFVMTGFKNGKVIGDLSIKGVKKSVELDYEFGGTAVDPWGNAKAGFVLSGQINRNDFAITWNKALETGGVVVSDTVKLLIEVEGNGVKK
ncbi:MAG: YceI family protein [Campylobacterales bacterium]